MKLNKTQIREFRKEYNKSFGGRGILVTFNNNKMKKFIEGQINKALSRQKKDLIEELEREAKEYFKKAPKGVTVPTLNIPLEVIKKIK